MDVQGLCLFVTFRVTGISEKHQGGNPWESRQSMGVKAIHGSQGNPWESRQSMGFCFWGFFSGFISPSYRGGVIGAFFREIPEICLLYILASKFDPQKMCNFNDPCLKPKLFRTFGPILNYPNLSKIPLLSTSLRSQQGPQRAQHRPGRKLSRRDPPWPEGSGLSWPILRQEWPTQTSLGPNQLPKEFIFQPTNQPSIFLIVPEVLGFRGPWLVKSWVNGWFSCKSLKVISRWWKMGSPHLKQMPMPSSSPVIRGEKKKCLKPSL